jgi:hypothetical protein
MTPARTRALELVYHDGKPQSAKEAEEEYTFTEINPNAWGFPQFISKARLALQPLRQEWKDGYVTFKHYQDRR